MNKHTSAELNPREWVIVTIALSLFGALTFLSLTADKAIPAQPVTYNKPVIEVMLKGAIERPGVYRLKEGTTLRELLNLVQVNPSADLRRYALDKPIRTGSFLQIKERSMVTMRIKSPAGEEHTLTVPRGTSLEAVIPTVKGLVTQDTDFSPLRKKRKIREGELIQL